MSPAVSGLRVLDVSVPAPGPMASAFYAAPDAVLPLPGSGNRTASQTGDLTGDDKGKASP